MLKEVKEDLMIKLNQIKNITKGKDCTCQESKGNSEVAYSTAVELAEEW